MAKSSSLWATVSRAKPHGVCEVKLSKGKTIYEGKRISLSEMRRLGRKEWRKRFTGPTFYLRQRAILLTAPTSKMTKFV